MTWLAKIGGFFKSAWIWIVAALGAALLFVWHLLTKTKAERDKAKEQARQEAARADAARKSAERERAVSDATAKVRVEARTEHAKVDETLREEVKRIEARPRPPPTRPAEIAEEMNRRRRGGK